MSVCVSALTYSQPVVLVKYALTEQKGSSYNLLEPGKYILKSCLKFSIQSK